MSTSTWPHQEGEEPVRSTKPQIVSIMSGTAAWIHADMHEFNCSNMALARYLGISAASGR
jgi:hypothetical protein